MVLPAPISSFQGDFRFLSNFWAASVQLDGYWYPSVEHAYQAAKTEDEQQRRKIRSAKTASMAKHLGKYVPLRMGWDAHRISVMRDLLWQKFSSNPTLKQSLLATGEAELIEGNTWHDHFWGVCNGRGENHLGKLLMALREELRKCEDDEYHRDLAAADRAAREGFPDTLGEDH